MKIETYFSNIATVTAKLTNGCNLKCSYCNVEAMTASTPRMSLETAKRILDLLVVKSRHNTVSFEFHGGEPLLMGEDWLMEVFDYGRALAAKYGKTIEFPLVTNATLLTAARAKRLTGAGIRLSISCDGPPEINDLNRQGGKKVEKALKELTAADIPFGLMTVVGPGNFSQMPEIMDWLKELGIDWFVCNFSQPQGRGTEDSLLNWEQKLQNKIDIIRHMAENDCAVIEDDTLKMMQRFRNGREDNGVKTCWSFNCQAGHSYVAVDLNGDIHACGSDVSNHVLGNVSKDIDDNVFKAKMFRLHDQGDWALKCFNCNAQRICNHSCVTSDYNSHAFKLDECRFTKLLWNWMCENSSLVYKTLVKADSQSFMQEQPADNSNCKIT